MIKKLLTDKFESNKFIAKIPLLRGNGTFSAKLTEYGIEVNNLASSPLLPWVIFEKTIELLINQNGKALKGNAMSFKLGDPELPLDSVEGRIAHEVFNKKIGESVFRRITPISCILVWAGICKSEKGFLLLNSLYFDYDSSIKYIETNIDVKQPDNSVNDDNILNHSEYCNSLEIQNFIKWVNPFLDTPNSFNHSYHMEKYNIKWECNSLYSAVEGYYWPFRLKDPITNSIITGDSFIDNNNVLFKLAFNLEKSINQNNLEYCQKFCIALLEWGGVSAYNKETILEMGDELCDYLKEVQLELSKLQINANDCNFIKINSGFSKIYSLIVNNFIIYDGRVGSAICLLVREFCKDNHIDKIPKNLLFAWSRGKSVNPEHYNRRNPSYNNLIFPELNHTNYLKCNIKASWLLDLIINSNDSKFSRLDERLRLRALEAALFMVGYKVN